MSSSSETNSTLSIFFGDRLLSIGVDPSEEHPEISDHALSIIQSHDAILRCVRLVMEEHGGNDFSEGLLSHPADLIRNAMVGAEFLASMARGLLITAAERRALEALKTEPPIGSGPTSVHIEAKPAASTLQ